MALLCHEREPWGMKTNQYRDDSEPFRVLYSANDTVDRTGQGPELDRAGHNRVLRVRNSPSSADGAATTTRRPFPLRTLMVCFTIWLIATQAMIFDQVRFETGIHLLEQSAQSFGGPQVVVPNERPSNPTTGANLETL
jgi:hypothetical protein